MRTPLQVGMVGGQSASRQQLPISTSAAIDSQVPALDAPWSVHVAPAHSSPVPQSSSRKQHPVLVGFGHCLPPSTPCVPPVPVTPPVLVMPPVAMVPPVLVTPPVAVAPPLPIVPPFAADPPDPPVALPPVPLIRLWSPGYLRSSVPSAAGAAGRQHGNGQAEAHRAGMVS